LASLLTGRHLFDSFEAALVLLVEVFGHFDGLVIKKAGFFFHAVQAVKAFSGAKHALQIVDVALEPAISVLKPVVPGLRKGFQSLLIKAGLIVSAIHPLMIAASRLVLGKFPAVARTVALGIVLFLELDWTPPALASDAWG
jgi:hypothetical protein